MSEKLRLFTGVGLPDEQRAWLADQLPALQAKWPEGRWVHPGTAHVTLKFLGSVASERLDEISAAIGGATSAATRSEIALDGLGSFPSRRRMRVLWVAVEDPAGVLARLATELDATLGPLGFPAERRSFTPHLTLARFRTPVRLQEPLPQPDRAPGPFALDEITLYRSHLHPRGARYEALASFPLPGPGA